MTSTRLVAVTNGESCHHINVETTLNLSEQRKRYETWFHDEYAPALHRNEHPTYYSFVGWLVKNGLAVTAELEEFYDAG